jgi:hypothetical protein
MLMLALLLQDVTTSALLLILNSTRSTDITNLVKGLSGDQQDRLMAYLYKVSVWAIGNKQISTDTAVLITGNGQSRREE